MSIGRNYRLELDKKLREINKSRETTMSYKILDEDRHLLRHPNQKSQSKIKKSHKTNSTTDCKNSGLVPLSVKLLTYYHYIDNRRRNLAGAYGGYCHYDQKWVGAMPSPTELLVNCRLF